MKTLKDLPKIDYLEPTFTPNEYRSISTRDKNLRKEAIEWIKHWIKLLPKNSWINGKIDLNKIKKPSDYMKIGQIVGFFDFFDIKEGDLV